MQSVNMKALNICLLLLLFAAMPAMSQITKIMGTVTDARTKEPIPFVNILIRGTTLGVLSDFEGNFAIEFRAPSLNTEIPAEPVPEHQL
jgi:hypothetical protein